MHVAMQNCSSAACRPSIRCVLQDYSIEQQDPLEIGQTLQVGHNIALPPPRHCCAPARSGTSIVVTWIPDMKITPLHAVPHCICGWASGTGRVSWTGLRRAPQSMAWQPRPAVMRTRACMDALTCMHGQGSGPGDLRCAPSFSGRQASRPAPVLLQDSPVHSVSKQITFLTF